MKTEASIRPMAHHQSGIQECMRLETIFYTAPPEPEEKTQLFWWIPENRCDCLAHSKSLGDPQKLNYRLNRLWGFGIRLFFSVSSSSAREK